MQCESLTEDQDYKIEGVVPVHIEDSQLLDLILNALVFALGKQNTGRTVETIDAMNRLWFSVKSCCTIVSVPYSLQSISGFQSNGHVTMPEV